MRNGRIVDVHHTLTIDDVDVDALQSITASSLLLTKLIQRLSQGHALTYDTIVTLLNIEEQLKGMDL